jgi:uncharacterized protein (TIGR02444 family)
MQEETGAVTTGPPDLWGGMLPLYRREGVAEACLRLQDTCGADVPLLLAGAVLARSGLRLTPSVASALVSVTQDWRREVVLPLRALRRSWRERLYRDPLRDQLKSLELEAERRQVEYLQSLLATRWPLPRSEPGVGLIRENLEALLVAQGAGDWHDALPRLLPCIE